MFAQYNKSVPEILINGMEQNDVERYVLITM